MADYLRRFGLALWQDAVPWARDNILWAALMAVLPAITVYFRSPQHSIDWTMIRAALWLYLAVLTIYLLIHGLRAARKLDSELLKQIAFLQTQLAGQVVITGLDKSDPKIEAEFVDERVFGDKSSSLRLTNRGDGAAYMVRVFPLKLTKRTLTFPYFAESLEGSNSARFTPFVGEQWGYDSHHDFVRALSEEWVKRDNYQNVREVVVPARIDYEDAEGNRFEADFELLYHGGQGYNHPERHKCIECRNFTYRRIPLGITLQSVPSNSVSGTIVPAPSIPPEPT
ncbi:MAG: hypothetical protein WA634_08820 [Silvibacterium sp.]